MYPSTPTPIPSGAVELPIDIPQQSLWDFAPNAIQVWNSIESQSGMMTLFQAFLLVLIVAVTAFILVGIIRSITEK